MSLSNDDCFVSFAMLEKSPENIMNSQENKQMYYQTNQPRVYTQSSNDYPTSDTLCKELDLILGKVEGMGRRAARWMDSGSYRGMRGNV